MDNTIISMKTNADIRLAIANTRTVALTAKHTAAPDIVVRNNVRKNLKNITTSNCNPSQHHTHFVLQPKTEKQNRTSQ